MFLCVSISPYLTLAFLTPILGGTHLFRQEKSEGPTDAKPRKTYAEKALRSVWGLPIFMGRTEGGSSGSEKKCQVKGW